MMMNSHVSRSHDRFATTRWSVVLRLADTNLPRARDALGDLAQRYWYPVYAFVRRCGHAPAAAAKATDSLLRRLVADSGSASQQVASGHYRSYLLGRVQAFRNADWTLASAAPGEAETVELAPPPAIESRFLRDHLVESTPEQAFQRSFALVVLHRTLRRLRDEAAETGRADLCRALEPFLVRDPQDSEFERLAAQLRCRKVTLIVALKRLRQRLRELAAEELSDTVSSADDLASEQSELLDILGEITA